MGSVYNPTSHTALCCLPGDLRRSSTTSVSAPRGRCLTPSAAAPPRCVATAHRACMYRLKFMTEQPSPGHVLSRTYRAVPAARPRNVKPVGRKPHWLRLLSAPALGCLSATSALAVYCQALYGYGQEDSRLSAGHATPSPTSTHSLTPSLPCALAGSAWAMTTTRSSARPARPIPAMMSAAATRCECAVNIMAPTHALSQLSHIVTLPQPMSCAPAPGFTALVSLPLMPRSFAAAPFLPPISQCHPLFRWPTRSAMAQRRRH